MSVTAIWTPAIIRRPPFAQEEVRYNRCARLDEGIMKHFVAVVVLLILAPVLSQTDELPCAASLPPQLRTFRVGRLSTMSIVARDPSTGELGVAVESHYFSVGPVVPWAEAGVGAVATQASAEPLYGHLGL